MLDAIRDRLEQTPSVASVTLVDVIPVANDKPIMPVQIQSHDRNERVYSTGVAPSYFRTLSIPLIAGRDFAAQDDRQAPAVGIVNETLARRLWPGGLALGERLEIPGGVSIEVIGVARDSRYTSLQEESGSFLYRPLAQTDATDPTFLVKTAANPNAVLPLLRSRIDELNADVAAYNVMTLDDRLGLGRVLNRAAATVAGSLGLIAFLLSAMGIYGTIAFLVQERSREIGVRLALGASPRSVTTLIVKQGMTWVGAGLAIGVLLAIAATLGLGRVLYGVSLADPVAFLATPMLLAAAAYLATYLPARYATRLDPLIALRSD
jgi:predicted permease